MAGYGLLYERVFEGVENIRRDPVRTRGEPGVIAIEHRLLSFGCPQNPPRNFAMPILTRGPHTGCHRQQIPWSWPGWRVLGTLFPVKRKCKARVKSARLDANSHDTMITLQGLSLVPLRFPRPIIQTPHLEGTLMNLVYC